MQGETNESRCQRRDTGPPRTVPRCGLAARADETSSVRADHCGTVRTEIKLGALGLGLIAICIAGQAMRKVSTVERRNRE